MQWVFRKTGRETFSDLHSASGPSVIEPRNLNFRWLVQVGQCFLLSLHLQRSGRWRLQYVGVPAHDVKQTVRLQAMARNLRWPSRLVRQTFFDYFKSRDHRFVRSSSVIPFESDGTYFVNAGMNQVRAADPRPPSAW